MFHNRIEVTSSIPKSTGCVTSNSLFSTLCHSGMSGSVRTQSKKVSKRWQDRKRDRIELTWSPDLINRLHKITDNISGFTERILRAVLFGEEVEVIAVIRGKGMPGAGFEPATMRSSAARSPELSYPGISYVV